MSGNPKKKLLRKATSSHTSFIATVEPLLAAVQKDARVTKVAFGPISIVGSGKISLKISRVQAGLRLRVRSSSAVQLLWIYTAMPDEVEASLYGIFKERYS